MTLHVSNSSETPSIFRVKRQRRIKIPDFVREQLSEPQIDDLWWEESCKSRDALQSKLQRSYMWVGEIEFVGRDPDWLVIEDTGDSRHPRNWDAVGKIVEQHLREFVSSMEDANTWRDIRGIDPRCSTPPA